MANATSINKSRIFKSAWKIYHSVRKRYAQWQFDRGIVDGSFASALKDAWAHEKRMVQEAMARFVYGAEIKALEAQKAALDYKPIGHSISDEQNRISKQISSYLSASNIKALFSNTAHHAVAI